MMGMFHQDTQLPTHRTGVPSPSCLATAAGTLGAVDSACGMTWMNSHHLFWRSLTYLKKHASRDHHPKYGITHGWNRQQLMQLSGLWLLKLDTNPPWNLQHKDKEWLEPNFAFVILPDYLGFASGTPQKVKQYQNISNIFPTDSSSSGFPSKKQKTSSSDQGFPAEQPKKNPSRPRPRRYSAVQVRAWQVRARSGWLPEAWRGKIA